MTRVLFVCLHNAGRSQMSHALFADLTHGRHEARSAGTQPADRVHAEVLDVMGELGHDLSDRTPTLLTRELAEWADVIVTMGCGDECPYVPGKRYVDWDLDDPEGQDLDAVREIRDDIRRRVADLAAELDRDALPVAVIGAGPVGLTAAAHLLDRGLEPLVLESGATDAPAVRGWGHVQLFSPWEYAIDPVAERLLRDHDWQAPPADVYPTGAELADGYTRPLAAALGDRVRYGHRVLAVTKQGVDKLKDAGREDAPFELVVAGPTGVQRILARAVLDASGTWWNPNPLGSGGLAAPGEAEHADRIAGRIPDVLGTDRDRYAGRRVLVVGSGHSAFNALADLAELRRQAPATTITWAIRRPELGDTLGGGEDDELVARGELGDAVGGLLDGGAIELVTGFETLAVSDGPGGAVALTDGSRELVADEVIAVTGFRPDLSLLGELRLALDDRVEAAKALAPLIDPNLHSCGTVPPHGVDELAHPDAGVYVIGMKSYGRAPTFLLRTGYEQARSVVAALAGDWEAARRVELELPETGVCSVDRGTADSGGCTPAAATVAGPDRVTA